MVQKRKHNKYNGSRNGRNQPAVQKPARPKQSVTAQGPTNIKTLDPETPIPLEINRNFHVSRQGTQYVPFLGEDDCFPQLLLEAKLLSPTNRACVSTKSQFCLGQGWYFNEAEAEQYRPFTDWARTLNRKGESLNDIIKGGFNSLFTCGNTYIEVVRGQIGSTKFLKVYKRNFLDCRLTWPEDEEFPTSVIVSREFRDKGIWDINWNRAYEVPIYSDNILDNSWWRDEKGFEHTIIHLKNDEEGYDFYGLPTNVASLPHQILEYKSARYNLDNFENNLVIGGVILLKGNLTDAEARKIGKKIVFQHSGDGKRGRFAILSSETNSIDGTDIKQFDKQKDGDFIKLDENLENKIISANEWDPYLAGIHRSTGLGTGGAQYIRSIFDIKNEAIIKPAQNFMIEKFLNPLLRIHDDWFGTRWSDNEMKLTTVLPVTFLGEIDVNAILTRNEGREIAGYEPLEEGKGGEEFIKSAKPATTGKGEKEDPENV